MEMSCACCSAWGKGLHPDDLAAVRSVRERIDRNPVSVPDIATLAREHAVSASKLSRDFKRAYGVSIHPCMHASLGPGWRKPHGCCHPGR